MLLFRSERFLQSKFAYMDGFVLSILKEHFQFSVEKRRLFTNPNFRNLKIFRKCICFEAKSFFGRKQGAHICMVLEFFLDFWYEQYILLTL